MILDPGCPPDPPAALSTRQEDEKAEETRVDHTAMIVAEMRTIADAADGFQGGVSSQAVRDFADRLMTSDASGRNHRMRRRRRSR